MICLINLCGLPFTLGFYIKHLILIAQNNDYFYANFVVLNVIVGAISGLFYSSNFLYYIFLDSPKGKKIIYNQATRNELKSYYYSNSTLASIIAITGLVVVSYVISSILIHLFLNKTSTGESLDIHSMYSSLSYEFILPTKSFLQNVSYIN
jgi:formate hydrogenlyase subunit 3/multisubunit Na+/H+ antiporter MnhD subunit